MSDQQIAAKWAFDLLQRKDWCILDTETTGLEKTAEICQIAVVDCVGTPLLNTLVKPTVPISLGATTIHGITNEQVQNAPLFEDVLLSLMRVVGKGDVIIYNAEFDIKLIKQSIRPYGIQLAFPNSDRRQCRIFTNGGSIHCAMLQFSRWVGEWNDYHGDYKWQKLPGGDHSALGDCIATLEIIHKMAASYIPMEPQPIEEDDDLGWAIGPRG